MKCGLQHRWPILAALLLWVSCSTTNSAGRQAFPGLPRTTSDGLAIEYGDLDGDIHPDIIKYYRPNADDAATEGQRIIQLLELDLDSDGLVNLRRHYDPQGGLLREETDGNLDGRIDQVVDWESSLPQRATLDSDDDGRWDTFRTYRGGMLESIERDLDGDGFIDSWAYYGQRGLVRVGYDTDGDGSADSWIQGSAD